MPKYLNIACGRSFVSHPDWENLDYVSASPYVKRSNLLGDLSASEPKYSILYCSHFIEHIPPSMLPSFLAKCRSLMTSDAVFRIAIPDAEFLMREFLSQRDQGNHLQAEYAFVCFLDQCVRAVGGGKLAEMNHKIQNGQLPGLEPYANYLLGKEAIISTAQSAAKRSSFLSKVRAVVDKPSLIAQRLEPRYVRALCALMPPAFRAQNVSLTAIGERHQWMYDFESIKAQLVSVGFQKVDRYDFSSSSKDYDIFEPLDSLDGQPRKGHHQLFVEAVV